MLLREFGKEGRKGGIEVVVGRQRYGGIFSKLNRGDIGVIRDAETFLLTDPDYGLTIDEIDDVMSLVGDKYDEDEFPGLENLTIDDLIEVTKGLRSQIASVSSLDQKGYEIERTYPESQRIDRGRVVGKYRYWEQQLGKVLQKLYRVQNQLENEELN